MNGLVRLLDWVGEEDRRTYVKTIPSRSADMDWSVRHRRVGSVATFTSWSFPAWRRCTTGTGPGRWLFARA